LQTSRKSPSKPRLIPQKGERSNSKKERIEGKDRTTASKSRLKKVKRVDAKTSNGGRSGGANHREGKGGSKRSPAPFKELLGVVLPLPEGGRGKKCDKQQALKGVIPAYEQK